MARKASSKPDSGSPSTVPMGFDTDSRALGIRHSVIGIYPVLPKPARRDSADLSSEGSPQVVNEARDNNAYFAWVQHFIHHLAPQGMADFILGKMKRDTAIAKFSLN